MTLPMALYYGIPLIITPTIGFTMWLSRGGSSKHISKGEANG